MADWITEDDVEVHLSTITSDNHTREDIRKEIAKAQALAEPYLRHPFTESVVKAWTTTTCPIDIKAEVAALTAARILNQFYDEPLHFVQGGRGTAYGLHKNAIEHFEKYASGVLTPVDRTGDNISLNRNAVKLSDNEVGRRFKYGTDDNPEPFRRW